MQGKELLQVVGPDVAVALIGLRLPRPHKGISLIQKLHATCPDIPLIAFAFAGIRNPAQNRGALAGEALGRRADRYLSICFATHRLCDAQWQLFC